jgi:hypothetical protein
MPDSNNKTRGDSVMAWAAVSWCSIVPNITLHVRITAREYVDRMGNQVHPMIQALFPNNDTVFQAGNAKSWFEEHGGELQYLR